MHRTQAGTNTSALPPVRPLQEAPPDAATLNVSRPGPGPAGRAQSAPTAPRAHRMAMQWRLERQFRADAARRDLVDMETICSAQERQIEGLATDLLALEEAKRKLERELESGSESGVRSEVERDDGERLRQLIGQLHLDGPGTRISHHPMSHASEQNALVEVQERNLRLLKQSEELTAQKDDLTPQLNDALRRLEKLAAQKDSMEAQLAASQAKFDPLREKLDAALAANAKFEAEHRQDATGLVEIRNMFMEVANELKATQAKLKGEREARQKAENEVATLRELNARLMKPPGADQGRRAPGA